MSAVARLPHAPAEAARSFLIESSPNVLRRITEGGLNLVAWQRPLPETVAASLERWLSTTHPRFEGVIDSAIFDPERVLGALDDSEARTWLGRDLGALIGEFSTIAGKRKLCMSFGAVTTDQCRKLHVDYIRLRLTTTYVGPGTQWLADDAVDRDVLARPPECPDEANEVIARRPGAVQSAATGDVLVLKGQLGHAGYGVVHRSPSIEARELVRLVLVLTPEESRTQTLS